MQRRLTFRSEVAQDIHSIIEYIEQTSSEAAHRFANAAVDACDDLVLMPGKGSLKPLRRGSRMELRSWFVPGFPNHLILYEVLDDQIIIVAILHGARNIPQILRKRK